MQSVRPYSNAVRTGAKSEKRKTNRKSIVLIALFFVCLFIGAYLNSPLAKVEAIIVSGNHQIRSVDILKKSNLKMEMNLWKVNQSDVQATLLRAFPLFSSVSVRYQFPNHILIHVTEKKTAALLMAQGKFYHMLEDGTLLDEVPVSYGAHLPIVSSEQTLQVQIGKPISDKQIVELAKELAAAPEQELSIFSDFEVSSDHIWIANTLDGFEVQFEPGHFLDKLGEFQDFHKQLIEEGHPPGEINMMDTRPYYSPFPKSQSKDSTKNG